MSREAHVRFWERAEVKSLRATRLPLYRQSEIYAREGIDLARSTMADWVGKVSALLAPLVAALRSHVFAGTRLHGDDTPVPVLEPGRGKTKKGRLWPYIRDGRPYADQMPPAVCYFYSPDRKGRSSAHPPQDIPRHPPCRRLCRLQGAL